MQELDLASLSTVTGGKKRAKQNAPVVVNTASPIVVGNGTASVMIPGAPAKQSK